MNAANVLWASCALIFTFGVGCVWWPASQQLAQVRARVAQMEEQSAQNNEDVRRSREMLGVRARVVSEIRHVTGQQSEAATTSSAISLIDSEAGRYGIEVRSLLPATSVPDSPAADPLQTTSMLLDVRGRFRNVVALIGDLPRHDVLVEMRGASMAAAGGGSQDAPALDVTLDVTLYRLRDRTFLEGSNATGAL